MRRLSFSNKKVRGIPRRLRALRTWADGFTGYFPADVTSEERYLNYKIPVLMNLVQGKQAKRRVRAECAQILVDACDRLIKAKPESAKGFRVVATISLPDMFSSEVCIYTDEAYFQSKIQPVTNANGQTKLLHGRSLAREWSLTLPDGFKELGVSHNYQGDGDPDDRYIGEVWQLGEVL